MITVWVSFVSKHLLVDGCRPINLSATDMISDNKHWHLQADTDLEGLRNRQTNDMKYVNVCFIQGNVSFDEQQLKKAVWRFSPVVSTCPHFRKPSERLTFCRAHVFGPACIQPKHFHVMSAAVLVFSYKCMCVFNLFIWKFCSLFLFKEWLCVFSMASVYQCLLNGQQS